ncbi:peptidoglycan-binding domain-containing protein [Chachezhania sediminis]|uniref:peptidoglycan-binding domain-containing protein n=1 Tax=Chachezhania sediminis TaxID=2599291 RepID=UPI00131E362C|nr:peptidoglycan-binding domain-containing protein [Chachezhania sediminis]
MRASSFVIAAAAAIALTAPAPRARADNTAAVVGGLVVGGLLINEVVKQNRAKRIQQENAAYQTGVAAAQQQARTTSPAPRRSAPAISSAQREQNRQVQTALNFFGYDAGSVDGVMGAQSRSAASRYQADMGDAADGTLSKEETQFLLSGYQRARASAGVPRYDNVMAQQGPAGLLRLFKAEAEGTASLAPATSVTPPPVPDRTAVAVADAVTLAPLPVVRTDSCGNPASGGLDWQACVARAHAVADGSSLEAGVTNMTPDQIKAHCEGLAQAMAPYSNGLHDERPSAVITQVSDFLARSGLPAEQAVDTGQVCLGVGYREDMPSVAMGSALMLVGAGATGYSEVIGHLLRDGKGVDRADPKAAEAWLNEAVANAVTAEGAPVLGQTRDRMAALASDVARYN